MHRFYIPDLARDSTFSFPDDEGHHLARVLRMKAGDEVTVFDGRGFEAVARVESVAGRRVTARVTAPRVPAAEARVPVMLAQALLKSDKMERVIRDAVMLGVAAIQPFASRRTDVPFKAMRGDRRQDRWERTVIASVKQCGRAVVPRVHDTKLFSDVLSSMHTPARLMFVEPGVAVDAADLTTLEGTRPAEATVLIGPEGGWDPEEIKEAAAAGVSLLSFGTRVLRADAAGAAVISVLRFIWRDL